MATTASLTTTPTQIDSGASDNVSITNTGTVSVLVSRGAQSATLQAGQGTVVYPEGTAVTAAAISGAGSVSYTATAARVNSSGGVTGTGGGTVATTAGLAADLAFTSAFAGTGFGKHIPDDGSSLYPPAVRPQTYVASSDLVTQFESGHGWTGSSGFVANDTSDFITGVQSSKITTAGTGSYKIESGAVSLDLTGKQVRIRVKVDDITNVSSVNFWAGNDSSYTNAYKWFVQGTAGGSNQIVSGGTTAQQGWAVVVLNVADAQLIGTPTRTGIVKLKFEISRTASAGEVTLHVDEVDLVAEPATLFPNGAVVICFDDILASTWTLAKPILDAYRYRASHFVITDEVGQSGRVTADQLRVMQDEGFEINSHAYTDADHGLTYTGLTAAQLDADLRAQKAWLRSNGFTGDGTAYPLGQYGTTTDGVSTHSIVRRYFSFARTTAGGTNKPGGTYPIGDPFRIPALSSVTTFSGGFTPATLLGTGTGSLDAVKAAHGVKVLTFHKIVTTTPGALTEILQSDFQSVIDGIASRGMTVLTLGELVAANAAASGGGSSVTLATTTPAADTITGSAGSASTASKSDHTHPRATFQPTDHGMIAWPYDPSAAASTTALATAGTVYLVKVHVPVASSVTNIITQVTTAGSTLTAGQCFAGIYQGGTLLGTTADQATAWASTGVKTMALAGGPIAVAAGDVYIAFVFNGTTGPTLPRGNGNALINAGLTAANSRYATADTGVTTTLPSTLGTRTALSVSYWAGLS